MPYPYQYQGNAGFGGNSFANASNPSPAAYPAGITAASRVQYGSGGGGFETGTGGYSGGSPTNLGNINITAGSKGLNPFGIGRPDLSQADPNMLNRLDISNLVYSAPLGGYITQAEVNSGKYNREGGDPNANRAASAYYNYIGSLPTVAAGSPALRQLNAASGVRASGPSYNTILSNFFNNLSPYEQDGAKKAGFGPTYGGPYGY